MSKIEEAERENPHKKLAGSMRVEWLTNPRDDHLSHWMLRLCYAENRDQFVNLEGHLFKVRLEQKTMNMDIESRAKFALEILLRYYRSVDYHVEEQYQKENRMEYLKIPFEDAISMMSEHRVIIKQGYGYIPRKFYLNLVRLLFGRNLRQEMTQIGEYLMEIVSKDERLKKLIDTIPKMAITKDFIKTDYSSKRGNINISDIGTMASLHYPLCMKEVR